MVTQVKNVTTGRQRRSNVRDVTMLGILVHVLRNVRSAGGGTIQPTIVGTTRLTHVKNVGKPDIQQNDAALNFFWLLNNKSNGRKF